MRSGRIRRHEIIHAQVKIQHPNRTGLSFHDGTWIQTSAPFYLQEMEVHYGGQRVNRFEMTPALSDDPLITFALRAWTEGPLRVVLVNNLGERFDATREIRFS